jgi:hypothetical protein
MTHALHEVERSTTVSPILADVVRVHADGIHIDCYYEIGPRGLPHHKADQVGDRIVQSETCYLNKHRREADHLVLFMAALNYGMEARLEKNIRRGMISQQPPEPIVRRPQAIRSTGFQIVHRCGTLYSPGAKFCPNCEESLP